MNNVFELGLYTVAMGCGATIVMDVWNQFLARLGIKSLNFRFLGRWIGHLPRGVLIHKNIAAAEPIAGELWIGYCAHYSIGIGIAATHIFVWGVEWLQYPSLLPAMATGIVTVLAPYFILQPGLGLGIASSKAPSPARSRIKSLASHTAFGLGLYISALIGSRFI